MLVLVDRLPAYIPCANGKHCHKIFIIINSNYEKNNRLIINFIINTIKI